MPKIPFHLIDQFFSRFNHEEMMAYRVRVNFIHGTFWEQEWKQRRSLAGRWQLLIWKVRRWLK